MWIFLIFSVLVMGGLIEARGMSFQRMKNKGTGEIQGLGF